MKGYFLVTGKILLLLMGIPLTGIPINVKNPPDPDVAG